MTTDAKTKTLLDAIERRLTDISDRQHALAVEKARLLEQLTPLRLGVVTPETAVVQLKAKGVTLRGLTAAWSGARRPRPVILKEVASTRPAMSNDQAGGRGAARGLQWRRSTRVSEHVLDGLQAREQ